MPNDLTADVAAERARVAAEVWEKAARIRVGMLTAKDGNQLNSRPMTIQQVEPSPGVVCFFTGLHGNRAVSIGAGAAANLTVTDHSDSFYVSIAGDAKLVDDRAKKEELWSMMAKAWFPGGLDDPNLGLIRLEVHSVEYWDSDHSKMVQMLMMAKAAMTGHPPTDISAHGTVDTASALRDQRGQTPLIVAARAHSARR
jgi:general stress protein 26